MKTLRNIVVILFLGMLLVSCEETLVAEFEPQLVLEGYLYANELMDSIVIRQTVAITSSDSIVYVPNAIVTFSFDGQDIRLIEKPDLPGRYFPPSPILIEPNKTYGIRVEALGKVATSETTVPQPIRIDSVKIENRRLSINGIDTVDYPKDRNELSRQGVCLWWSRSSNALGYGIEAVTFDTTAEVIDMDPTDDNLPDSNSMGRYRFFIVGNSEQVVWRQFRRYGVNTVRALALDRNLQDFALGLYFTGSQFDNNTLHVNGGLGVFGSAARASTQVYMRKTMKDPD